MQKTIKRVAQRALRTLKMEPDPVVYARGGKLGWRSDDQRKAYYASRGFGRGVPYVRRTQPNRMVDQWQLITVYTPGEPLWISLENEDPVHVFVTGLHQQPFHEETGWYNEEDIADTVIDDLLIEVEEDLDKVWGKQ